MSAPRKPRIVPAVARLDKPPALSKARKAKTRRQIAAWQKKKGTTA